MNARITQLESVICDLLSQQPFARARAVKILTEKQQPMSATILAAKIVSEWDELSADNPVNRETYIRNLLVAFQVHIASETIADITSEIKP